MRLNNFVDDSQPQPCPGFFGRKVRVKNLIKLLGMDPLSSVAHSDVYILIVINSNTHGQSAAVLHRLYRVKVEVEQALSHSVRVNPDRTDVICGLQIDGNVLICRILLNQLEGLGNKARQIGGFTLQIGGASKV